MKKKLCYIYSKPNLKDAIQIVEMYLLIRRHDKNIRRVNMHYFDKLRLNLIRRVLNKMFDEGELETDA